MLRLHGLGWGARRIAAELGCDRETVQRYVATGGWAAYRGPRRPGVLAGLALLLNIVGVAMLSVPGPLRVFMNEPANTIIAEWPFVWLPAFVVPVALWSHLLSLRQLVRRGAREHRAALAEERAR